jgi:hypothetical protein
MSACDFVVRSAGTALAPGHQHRADADPDNREDQPRGAGILRRGGNSISSVFLRCAGPELAHHSSACPLWFSQRRPCSSSRDRRQRRDHGKGSGQPQRLP